MGKRLNESEAGELAAEFEDPNLAIEGAEPESAWPEPIGRGRGRPSLTGHGEPSPELRARVTPATRDAVVALAERQGRSASSVVREAIERYITEAV